MSSKACTFQADTGEKPVTFDEPGDDRLVYHAG